MRIVSVNHTADVYGASRCLERLAARLVAEGHELLVVLPRAGTLKALLEQAGVTVRLHPLLSVIDRNTTRRLRDKLALLLTLPLSATWLAWTIVRFRADLVHSNSGVMLSPALAAKLVGRPHVWHVREFFHEFPRLWSRYQQLMFGFSDAIIAVSQAVRDQFDDDVRSKVWVVYDGLPRDEFDPSRIDPAASRNTFDLHGRPSVCVVGRLKWTRKGQEVLIRAVGLLKHRYPDAVYLIVGTAAPGSEDHLQRFQTLAKQLGVSKNVVFTGDIADARPVYAAVDVSVVPSVDPEPFGCVVMESMALNTVVVGSNAAGIAEQIVDGETGYLFPPGDEHSLADALDRLLSNARLRETMGRKGRERFLACFEQEHSYRAHMGVFEAVLQGTAAIPNSPDGAVAK